jgi:hypothetical protein
MEAAMPKPAQLREQAFLRLWAGEGSDRQASEYFPNLVIVALPCPPWRNPKNSEGAMRRSDEWRDKATEYWEKAKTLSDFALAEQYFELAARCLDMAEKLEDETVVADGSVSP